MRNYSGYTWEKVLNEYSCQTFFFMSMMKREQNETVEANKDNSVNKTLNGGFIGS